MRNERINEGGIRDDRAFNGWIRIFWLELDLRISIDVMRDCCVSKLVWDFLRISFKALTR